MKHNPNLRRKPARTRQDGYVLIVMMLFFALLAITLTAVAPAMMQRIRREREIELIHRGKQYARAIRLYYRKFGRYPVKLEDLENTNNLRFLRKRFKDPMTPSGQWRLIHYGEATLTMPGAGPVMPGATAPGGAPLGAAGTGASLGVAGAGNSSAFASTFSLGPQPGQSTSGTSSAQSGNTLFQASGTPSQSGTTATTSTESSQTSQSGPAGQAGQAGQTSGQPGQPGTPTSQLSSPAGTGPVLGGGPIVGVASTSKKESIKEINKKTHYNDWEFVYDPTLDLTMAQPVAGGATGQQNPLAPGGLGLGTQAPGTQPPGTQFGPTLPGMPGMQPTQSK